VRQSTKFPRKSKLLNNKEYEELQAMRRARQAARRMHAIFVGKPEAKKTLDRPKQRRTGRVQTKCSTGSSRLRAGRGANDPTADKFTVTKPWRKPRSTQGCSDSREDTFVIYVKSDIYIYKGTR
jgi:hypothetical protein